MKKMIITFLLMTLFFQTLFCASLDEIKPGFAKNVIFLIPNGSSASLTTLSRWVYNNNEPLNLDSFATGIVRTHSSSSIVSDGASSANAMATSWKTSQTELGLKNISKGDEFYPVASILESAKLSGKAVGIVVTSNIKDPTPGAFTSHVSDSNNYRDITEQQVFQDIDVIFGGGLSYLKKDKDFTEIFKGKGYEVIYTLNDLKKSKGPKTLGIFSSFEINYDLDRNKDKEPSLAQMTAKAIEILSKNKDGFFLVVEGSKIDNKIDMNIPIANVSEFIAFDKAVGEALEFAKKNKNTLIIVASTHAMGGINLENNANEDKIYKILKNAKTTEEKVAKMIIKNPQFASGIIKDNLGFSLPNADIKKVKSMKNSIEIQKFLGNFIAKSANISYTTTGHIGGDVTLYVYYPDSSRTLTGTVQSSDLALYAAKALNLNLEDTTKKLFIPGSSLKSKNLNLKIDDSDKFNTEFIITNPKERTRKEYIFFKNHNYFEVDGVRHYFNGVIVYNEKDVFFPEEAINLILPSVKSTQKKKKTK